MILILNLNERLSKNWNGMSTLIELCFCLIFFIQCHHRRMQTAQIDQQISCVLTKPASKNDSIPVIWTASSIMFNLFPILDDCSLPIVHKANPLLLFPVFDGVFEFWK